MHAVVSHVSLDMARAAEGTRMLEERVLPAMRERPGFVAGYWTEEEGAARGVSMTVWETEEAARQASEVAEPLRARMAELGVTFESITVNRVVAGTSR